MVAPATDPAAAAATVTTMTSRTERLASHLDEFAGFVRRQVRDPELAADVLQEAFTKALRHEGSVRDDEKLVAWFYRVLRTTIVDLHRRGGARPPAAPLDDVEPAAPEVDQAAACACLGGAIDLLPPPQRDLLRALELSDEDPAAAAARLGITPGNLRVRRHRARKALQDALHDTCRMCARHGCVDCHCREPGPAAPQP